MSSALTVQQYLKNPAVQQRVSELLKQRAGQFTTSLLSAINANYKLAHCKPETVLNAAITAASLDLPINSSLGFAYIIPYGDEAQFQIGYKGIIQLAQRSGQYKTIATTQVYEGQLIDEDPLKGNTYDWKARSSDKILGYVAQFTLINGFEKELYMTAAEAEAHGKKYSQTYKRGGGKWAEDFDAMANKTVVKLLISKYGPMSVDMQKAIISDQAIIKDDGIVYADNDNIEAEKADEETKNAIIEANIVQEEPEIPTFPVDEEPTESVKDKAARKYGTKDDKAAPAQSGK